MDRETEEDVAEAMGYTHAFVVRDIDNSLNVLGGSRLHFWLFWGRIHTADFWGKHSRTVPNPTSFGGFLHQLHEVNPNETSGKRQSAARSQTTYVLSWIAFSTPPDLALPLNLVKSSTWLTVSTNDVPQAWIVCKKDACLWSIVVSDSNSADARIYARQLSVTISMKYT